MFGREAAVKHTLLESENPKYLGTDDGMINVGLMTKLYHIVAHNLNEARKARDGNKKGKTPKEPEVLKVGDNVLVRDHTSKAFQPKYKDFCIVGLFGKNQIEIKDNHGHITKVHRKDVKKIPMTEKVCQLYEEEQVGKTREGRKAVPANKMPDLGWDIAETLSVEENQREEQHDTCFTNNCHNNHHDNNSNKANSNIPRKTSSRLIKKAVQATKYLTSKASRNILLQNIKDFYKTAALAVSIATNMTDHTSCNELTHRNNRNSQNNTYTRKSNDEYDYLYQSHSAGSYNISSN